MVGTVISQLFEAAQPADIGLVVLRTVVGLIFAAHGAQKLFGWFGGHGLKGTSAWLASMGVRPAQLWAVLAGLAEFLGGLGVFFGFATPIAAALVSAVMLAAIVLVHWPRFWVSEGGIEYPLIIIAAAALLGLAGPGAIALDQILGTEAVLPRTQTYLAGILLAVAAVLLLALLRTPARQVAGARAQARA